MPKRAAVCIGVNRAGGMTPLKAAAEGARAEERREEGPQAEGVDAELVQLVGFVVQGGHQVAAAARQLGGQGQRLGKRSRPGEHEALERLALEGPRPVEHHAVQVLVEAQAPGLEVRHGLVVALLEPVIEREAPRGLLPRLGGPALLEQETRTESSI